jgi:hypothetical protein
LDLGSRIKDQGSRIKERKGLEIAPPSALREPEKNLKADKKDTDLQIACRKTWQSYCDAYYRRYSVEPVRNAKVNAQIKQFCQAVAHAEAPYIAEFYVSHNLVFYVRRAHDTGSMLQDASKLRMEWATGRNITQTNAQQLERTSSMLQAAEQVKRDLGIES